MAVLFELFDQLSLSALDYFETYIETMPSVQRMAEGIGQFMGENKAFNVYAMVQYCPRLIPRLWMMIIITSIDLRTWLSSPHPDENLIEARLEHLVGALKAAQTPIKGLILHHLLVQVLFPLGRNDASLADIHDRHRHCLAGACQWILAAFLQMNRLWIRHAHHGSYSQRATRQQERLDLRPLVAVPLQMISQLHPSAETFTRQLVEPILAQLEICRDRLAQEWILQCLWENFAPHLHRSLLTRYVKLLKAFGWDARRLVRMLLDRLVHGASPLEELVREVVEEGEGEGADRWLAPSLLDKALDCSSLALIDRLIPACQGEAVRVLDALVTQLSGVQLLGLTNLPLLLDTSPLSLNAIQVTIAKAKQEQVCVDERLFELTRPLFISGESMEEALSLLGADQIDLGLRWIDFMLADSSGVHPHSLHTAIKALLELTTEKDCEVAGRLIDLLGEAPAAGPVDPKWMAFEEASQRFLTPLADNHHEWMVRCLNLIEGMEREADQRMAIKRLQSCETGVDNLQSYGHKLYKLSLRQLGLRDRVTCLLHVLKILSAQLSYSDHEVIPTIVHACSSLLLEVKDLDLTLEWLGLCVEWVEGGTMPSRLVLEHVEWIENELAGRFHSGWSNDLAPRFHELQHDRDEGGDGVEKEAGEVNPVFASFVAEDEGESFF